MNRTISGTELYPIGLGCMSLSHAYGTPPDEAAAIRLLHEAIERGVNHLDTAALYGFGKNETLLGKALKGRRSQVHLASKCGMTGVDGQRVIDGRPETLKKTIDEALARLGTDVIDLYYLHRFDKRIPIEESYGALVDILNLGKIRAIGLSEVSADTIRKAHAIHPVAAVQTEYSLWTRNVEIAVLNACEELDIALVAFSPLARGFFANSVKSLDVLLSTDIRHNLPRFQEPNFSQNLTLLDQYKQIAQAQGVKPGQLALAWLLAQSEKVIPIPGTTSIEHLVENTEAAQIRLDDTVINDLNALINVSSVHGARYPTATQLEIDTEEFAQ